VDFVCVSWKCTDRNSIHSAADLKLPLISLFIFKSEILLYRTQTMDRWPMGSYLYILTVVG
jgi:hypothetical protein